MPRLILLEKSQGSDSGITTQHISAPVGLYCFSLTGPYTICRHKRHFSGEAGSPSNHLFGSSIHSQGATSKRASDRQQVRDPLPTRRSTAQRLGAWVVELLKRRIDLSGGWVNQEFPCCDWVFSRSRKESPGSAWTGLAFFYTNCGSRVKRTSSTTESTPIFSRTWARWKSAVFWLMPNS